MKIVASRCIKLCPHIAKIGGVLYWILRLRAEHPIITEHKGKCHFCKKEVIDTNIILPEED